jgi:hypothetical protein
MYLSRKGHELKVSIILYIVLISTSVASAEVYRWEDANGLNFTDNSASVPERYREKPSAETGVQSGNTGPRARVGMYRQVSPAAALEQQAAVRQADPAHHRRTAQAREQQQITTRDRENTLQSLAKYIVIWIVLVSCLLVVWIAAIVDIVRSEFVTPLSKTAWMLVVLCFPLLGMLPYMILGSNQKGRSAGCRERHLFGVACR